MNTVHYISHMLEENVEDIKSLALYFEQINIIEQRHLHLVVPIDAKPNSFGRIKATPVSTNDFTDEKFLLHLKEFENKKIIKYLIDIDSGGKSPEKGLGSVSSDMQINDLVLSHIELLGRKYNERRSTDNRGRTTISSEIELNKEAELITKALFPEAKSLNKILDYYARTFKTFVNYYENGQHIITTSKYVNDMFIEIKKTERFKEVQKAFANEFSINPSFAFEAVKIGLPNVSKFPLEEILRFKENSREELQAFQEKLESITFDLLNNYDYEYINNNAQKIADLKIKPLVENISETLSTSKFSTMRELLKEVKDPKSYSPLLLTFSDKISSSLILTISAGLIGLNAGMEHYSKIKEAKKDGVYYLYKMKKYFS